MAQDFAPFGDVDRRHWWTIEDLERLPDDGHRYEILDGQLVMAPPPSLGHQNIVSNLSAELRSAFGDEYKVLEGVGLDMAPTLRIPDVMVFAATAFSPAASAVRPDDVSLVVEIVSPGSRTTDRVTKPAEYAAAGIRSFWRVETDPALTLTVYQLAEGASSYTEVGTWGEGQIAVIKAPVEVTIDVSSLSG